MQHAGASTFVFVEGNEDILSELLRCVCVLRLKSFIFCVLLFVNAALPSAGLAAVYYLDAANGDDSNPGSNELPWRTMDKVQAVAQAGDTVVILNVHEDTFTADWPDGITYQAPGITQSGITWTFDQYYTVGRFANRDYWVIANPNVTIMSIEPVSQPIEENWTGVPYGPNLGVTSRIMHGSMINPDPDLGTAQGYDSHMYRFPKGYSPNYNPDLNRARPNGQNLSATNTLVLPSNSSLVSCQSHTIAELQALGSADGKANLKSAAILTVLGSPAPAGGFRPPYAGTDKTIKFNKSQLDYSVFSSLAPAASIPRLNQQVGDKQSESLERMFERPWIEHGAPDWMAVTYAHPADNMPWYGREIADQIGLATLMLNLDLTNQEKEKLLIRFVQLGIDLAGIASEGGYWPPNGGIFQGRKLPILIAGLVLNDSNMKNVGNWTTLFQEDAQTFYVEQTSPEVVNGGYGGYTMTDVGLPEWGIRHATEPSMDNKSWTATYRDINGMSLVGYVLAVHIMGQRQAWNHDAFFEYMDRYRSLDKDGAMSAFANNMWNTYRADYAAVWTMSPTLSVTPAPVNGAVICDPDKPVYELGETVTLKAIPDGAYEFAGWSGDLSGTENPTTITMHANRSIGANFTYVAPDTTPPQVTSVNAVSESCVKILFSERLDTLTAENSANYSVNGISITAASLDSGQVTVTLTTSAHAKGEYTLTVVGLKDPSGNVMPQTQVDYQYAEGLIGYWKFDEGSGTTVQDSSGLGNTATLIGEPTWTVGKIGGALQFDGIDDYVNLGTPLSQLDGAYAFSIVFWIKVNSLPFSGDQGVICRGADSRRVPWILTRGGQSSLLMTAETVEGGAYDVSVGTRNLAPTRWQQLAFTWDGSNARSYLDGTLASTASSTGSTLASANANLIFAKHSTGGYFAGALDDVRIHNRALSAAEVADLFGAGSNLPPELSNVPDTLNKSEGETVSKAEIELATDADQDTLTYTYSGWLTSLPYDITHDDAGTHTLHVEVSDGVNPSVGKDITITVNTSNGVPELTTVGDKSIDENSLLIFSVDATDSDGDALTYSAESLPSGAFFLDRTFTWTPGYNQAGAYQVTFVVTDGIAQDSEEITITVGNVNRAPVLGTMDDKSAFVSEPLTFTVDAADPDGDTIEYSAQGLPSGATFASQTFSWTPEYSQLGSCNVTFIASDGQLEDSETTTITVSATDTSAPTVTNCSPAADSIQVPLNSLISLHVVDVGKGVDANSVAINVNDDIVYSGNTAYYSSASGGCRRSGTKADYSFVYQSQQMFDFDQSMTVTVNAADLAGNVMTQHFYAFTTEMRSFGSNQRVNVDSATLSEGSPVTVAGSDGSIWAAWHAGPAGNRDIYVGKLAPDVETFAGSVLLTDNPADQCNPAIASDDNDNIFVVWQDNRRGNWDVYVSTSADGANWSVEQRVTDSNDNQIDPAIAIDGQSPNRVCIVWQDDSAGNHDICLATSSNAFVTRTVSQITSNTSNQSQPAIAVDSQNIVYVVWTDGRNGQNDIYGAASNYGPWTNVPIISNARGQSNPGIATETIGSILHLVWVDDATGDRDIYYAATNGLPGTPVTGSTIIDDSSTANQLAPAIAVTGSTGNNLRVFACWQDWRNVVGYSADTDLYFAEISSARGTNVFVGDDRTSANQGEPAVGIDEYGYPYLVWTDDRNSTTDIYFAGSTHIATTALASEDVPTSTGTTVGTQPDAISSTDDVSVTVPSGAYPCDIKIQIFRVDNPQTFDLQSFTLPYEFSPSGIQFTTPVTITIPYTVAASAGSPSAYWYDPLTAALSRQGITDVQDIVISPTLHALQFRTTHFTVYVGAGSETVSGDESASVADGGGGGGGGCSLSPTGDGTIVQFLVPYIALAAVMVVVKRRDARNRNMLNSAKGKS